MDEKSTLRLQDVIDNERQLIEEAAQAIPHSFASCTYALGYIRQPLYLCKTCDTPAGLCASCSVACHTDHEQVELFPKRDFRCDCPTVRLSHRCLLSGGNATSPINENNKYNQNFRDGGQFCRCGRPYNSLTELEEMLQCLSCEVGNSPLRSCTVLNVIQKDWFHESCLNLRESTPRQSSNHDERGALEELNFFVREEQLVLADTNHDKLSGVESETTDSDERLPPTRLAPDEHEAFVCRECVLAIAPLRQWAGTPGVMMLVQAPGSRGFVTLGRLSSATDEAESTSYTDSANSMGEGPLGKRKTFAAKADSDIYHMRETKRLRLSDGARCEAPAGCELALLLLNNISGKPVVEPSLPHFVGTGDIFLAPNFRKRWCSCSQCTTELQKYPFLLQNEETYEPPEDPDANLSLEELGLRALQSMPRDKAIDGIVAYNHLRDNLRAYLRPYAQENKEVSASDVQNFFDSIN